MKTSRKLIIASIPKKSSNFGKTLALFVFLIVLTRCTVMSFYPLYTKDELVTNDKIIGTWMSRLIDEDVSQDSLVWEISFKDKNWEKKINNPLDKGTKEVLNQFTYMLKLYPLYNPDDWLKFDIHIVELDNNLYLDFLLEDSKEYSDNVLKTIHLLPVHTFAKLDINKDITIKWLDGEFLEDLLEQSKIRIRHEKRKDSSILTAKPKELQKFIIKYAHHPKAYNKDLSFILTSMNKGE